MFRTLVVYKRVPCDDMENMRHTLKTCAITNVLLTTQDGARL